MSINELEVKKIDKEYIHYTCTLPGYDGIKRVMLSKNESFVSAIEKGHVDIELWQKLRN